MILRILALKIFLFLKLQFFYSIDVCGNGFFQNIVTTSLFMTLLQFPWKCFRFDDEFTANDLKNFVRQKTGIYLPLPGCLEDFDILADKLMTTSDAGKHYNYS